MTDVLCLHAHFVTAIYLLCTVFKNLDHVYYISQKPTESVESYPAGRASSPWGNGWAGKEKGRGSAHRVVES